MSAPTVIVGGMIASTPDQGGAAWAVLQYLLGLRDEGCDVWFAEPLGAGDAERSARYCRAVMERFGLDGRWALLPPGGEPIGMTRARLDALADSADVLVNISGLLRDEWLLERIPRRLYLDLDPVFTQLWHAVDGVDMGFGLHTHFASLSDAIGTPGSAIPACGRDWLAILPPVALAHWPVADGAGDGAVTTVGHWRSYGSIHHGGVQYGQRAHSMRALLELPRHSPVPLRPALAIDAGETDDLRALAAAGWTLTDPAEVARTPDAYRAFVQASWAELCVAKSGYVVAGSGWFSDRSAAYLASGRPVVAQDTGFGRRLPAGSGLLAYDDADSAAAALEELQRDYDRHRRAARELAEQHLASGPVVRSLLDWVSR